jgi:hypothetical protein
MRIALTGVVIGLAAAAPASQPRYGLPPGAVLVEERPLPGKARPDRALVLWMLHPEKHPRLDPSEPYTCPEYTRGSYYSGRTRVSLVDTRGRMVINTLKIVSGEDTADTFDVPYRLRGDYSPYPVPRRDANGEGTPRLMDLKDYNGDGKALEFAIFDGSCCMCMETALIGYEPADDRVVWYAIDLTLIYRSTTRHVSRWGDHLFAHKPLRPGYWKYEMDYTGRGGSLNRFEVRYNRVKKRFEGTVVSEDGQDRDTE